MSIRLGGARAVGVFAITVLGCALVLGGLVVMNQFTSGPEESDTTNVVNFTVPPPPPEPPPRRQEPQQRRPRRSNRPALAPAPNLGTSLSGIQVSLPEFEVGGVAEVSESLLGDLEDVALTEGSVDEPPVVQSRPLTYPERAKQRNIEGRVVISALVGTDGRVRQMQILEANPPGVFEQAVQNAVPNWTFRPARYNGEAVETWVTIPIPFSLN